MASHNAPLVRKALPEEATALLALMDALADYEKLPRPDAGAKQRLVRDLFGPHPRLQALLVFLEGYPVGYAIVLETYSSFLARPTLYLEDLFVLPEFRDRGAGYALFREAAEEGRRRGCGRMEWTVLDWNQLAIDFYQRQGARHLAEWHLYRLDLTGLPPVLG